MCAVCVCIHMDTYTHTCMNTVRANRAETLNPMNTVRANRACLTLACAISSRTPFSRCVCPCLYVCLIYAMSVCVPHIRYPLRNLTPRLTARGVAQAWRKRHLTPRFPPCLPGSSETPLIKSFVFGALGLQCEVARCLPRPCNLARCLCDSVPVHVARAS